MAELEKSRVRKIYCNTCKVDTNHELMATHKRDLTQVEYEATRFPQSVFWEEFQYNFWVCRGCDTGTLEESYTNAGMQDPETDGQYWDSVLYPKREQTELALKKFGKLDNKLAAIYREIIKATNAGLKIAPAMCLRALLEGICVEKGITDEEAWGLEGKLKKLEEKSLLPPNIAESLHSFKFMGDSAAHQLAAPGKDKLLLAIEVMEDLLNFLYEVEYNLTTKAKMLTAKHYSTETKEFKKKRATKGGKNVSKESNS